MEFESFYFYTNQRALKNYLVNYKIEPSSYRNELNGTLSDLGQNYLLFWKSGIDTEVVQNTCKTNGVDIPVALKVLLPTDKIIDAYFSDGTIKSVKVADCASAYAVKVVNPVTFFNVSDIFYIDKQIQFLQGDTTLVIPKQLIRKEPYSISAGLNDDEVDCVIKSFSKTEVNTFMEDEDDETEFDANILSNLINETEDEKSIREKSQKEDKVNAASLMFVQGQVPFDGNFSHRLHSIIGPHDIPFAKVIRDNFYKNVSQDIVSENVRYMPSKDEDYIMALKGIRADNVYTPAISAILKNHYSWDDKERFLSDYLAESEVMLRDYIDKTFEDKRARSRIQLLLSDNPKLVPIYFLYTFFDYRLDHFCENIIEFGLDRAGLANITLSLWALLHGMQDVYAEYKNLELLYAIMHSGNSCCIDYKQFVGYNKIVPEKDNIVIENLSCCYVNPKIEYYHCVSMHEEKIKKLIDRLIKELKYTFDFQYVPLKNTISTINVEISDKDIIANRNAIHKQYLQSIKNEKSQRQRKSNTTIQRSFFD